MPIRGLGVTVYFSPIGLSWVYAPSLVGQRPINNGVERKRQGGAGATIHRAAERRCLLEAELPTLRASRKLRHKEGTGAYHGPGFTALHLARVIEKSAQELRSLMPPISKPAAAPQMGGKDP